MKRADPRQRAGIRFRMLSSLFAFTALTVLILWVCQNLFLEDIYKSIKTREIQRAGEKIALAAGQEDFPATVERIAEQYDVCVMVLAQKGSFQSVTVDITPDCVIHRMDNLTLNRLYARALDAEDGILYFSDGREGAKTDGGEQSIVLAAAAPVSGDTAIILLNSVITPVSATVTTLNRILGFVTVVLTVLSILLSLIISEWISRPIISITKGARELAKGNYNTEFKGGGCAEIDTLANTLNYAEGELSKTDRLQKELIANISHDLRTPLTMISGYSQIMRDIPGENTPENLQIVIDETERLTSLVNDVLDISKLRAGVGSYERKTLCLTEIADRAMTRYAKLAAGGYNIRCVYTEPLYINGDETRVLQVIYNLVNNAVTYTGEDKRVTLTIEKREQMVRLSVTDTGEGIPADKLRDIWERYYKVDKVHKRSAIGTGLGLSIVREIMTEHQGHYGVTSTPGIGSTFWVDFPLASESMYLQY